MVRTKLGKRIATMRRKRGFTQEFLAEKTAYSVEFISLIERGVNGPSIDGLERIAKALGVDIKTLFDFTDKL